MFCIYKATCLINQKVYIGKTRNFEKRKKQHLSGKENHLFSRAIQKYGAENFTWEIIEENIPDDSLANEREKYWISYYNSYFRWPNSSGYNMTKGGDGGNSRDSKRIACYDKSGNLIETFDSLTDFCNKYNKTTSLVSAAIRRNGCCAGMRVVELSDNYVADKIDSYVRNQDKRRKICKLSLSGELIDTYEKISDACKNGIRRSGIIACCQNRYKQSFGFQWCYLEDLPDRIGKSVSSIQSFKGDYIVKVSLNGELLNQYNNCVEAATQNGIKNYKLIAKAINSDSHFSSGFLWFKKSEYDNQVL